MISIRRKTFETNSSSTHSIIICTEKEFTEYTSGNLYENKKWITSSSKYANKNLVTREEAIDIVKNGGYYKKDLDMFSDYSDGDWDEELRSCGLLRYDDDRELEFYEEHYTSPSGDKIVAFGEYGYDG